MRFLAPVRGDVLDFYRDGAFPSMHGRQRGPLQHRRGEIFPEPHTSSFPQGVRSTGRFVIEEFLF